MRWKRLGRQFRPGHQISEETGRSGLLRTVVQFVHHRKLTAEGEVCVWGGSGENVRLSSQDMLVASSQRKWHPLPHPFLIEKRGFLILHASSAC